MVPIINVEKVSAWFSAYLFYVLIILRILWWIKSLNRIYLKWKSSVALHMSLLSLLINLMHSCWIKAEIKMFYIYCVKYLNGSASQFPQKYKVFLVLIIRNVSWVLKQHYDDNFWRIMWHWRLAAENPACHHRNTFTFTFWNILK